MTNCEQCEHRKVKMSEFPCSACKGYSYYSPPIEKITFIKQWGFLHKDRIYPDEESAKIAYLKDRLTEFFPDPLSIIDRLAHSEHNRKKLLELFNSIS